MSTYNILSMIVRPVFLFLTNCTRISPYSVRMRENMDQNNYEYRRFSRSNS